MSHKSTVYRSAKGEYVIESLDDYVVVDLETTGFSPTDDRVIEFAAAIVDGGRIVDTFSALANPGIPIPPRVAALTGITDDMVRDAPAPEAILPEFLTFIGSRVIVGHNVSFDINFLYDLAGRALGRTVTNDYINTCALARMVYPLLPDHRLQTLSAHCGIEPDIAHRALADVCCTQQLYERLRRFMRAGFVMPAPTVFDDYSCESIEQRLRVLMDDPTDLNVRPTKSYISVTVRKKLAFVIRANSRMQTLETMSELAEAYVDRVAGAFAFDGKYRFPLTASVDDTRTIDEMISAVLSEAGGYNTGHMFLCCNDFVACSDARHCLRGSDPEYRGCCYRKNLEAGRIFYGINRNI